MDITEPTKPLFIEQTVEKSSEDQLEVAKNQIELYNCIQIFYNFGILTDKLQNFANFSLKSYLDYGRWASVHFSSS